MTLTYYFIGFFFGGFVAGGVIGYAVGHWRGWCEAHDLFKENKVTPLGGREKT